MPPPEPPIFEIPFMVTGREDEPLFIQIGATIPGREDATDLEVYVDNLPAGSSFNTGRRDGDRWIFTPQEFGEVQLDLPPGFSGRLDVMITASASGASRQRPLVIEIRSIVNTTVATTELPPETRASDDRGEELNLC